MYLLRKLKVLKNQFSRLFYLIQNIMHKKMIQDWSYLKKYEKENAILAPPTLNENRIVFMGDSITEFWSDLYPEFFKNNNYINRGISGQTTPQMLIRFKADVIHLQPKTVVILAGANDIAGNTGPTTLEQIMNTISSMIELAIFHKINVIICSVLPANTFPWKSKNENPSQKIIDLNKMLLVFAKENKIEYLDCFSKMVGENNGMNTIYTDDGVHPNRKGYEIMSEIFESRNQTQRH